jgi:hypothetical protein
MPALLSACLSAMLEINLFQTKGNDDKLASRCLPPSSCSLLPKCLPYFLPAYLAQDYLVLNKIEF